MKLERERVIMRKLELKEGKHLRETNAFEEHKHGRCERFGGSGSKLSKRTTMIVVCAKGGWVHESINK